MNNSIMRLWLTDDASRLVRDGLIYRSARPGRVPAVIAPVVHVSNCLR
jgi:hypothetical protein